LLGLEGKLLSLIKGVLLLSADFDSSCDIKDGIFTTPLRSFFDELRNLFGLLSLDVAVKEKCCVVFIVVSERIKIRLMSL
jgi:hypothetical protein